MPNRRSRGSARVREGWHGWDEYAPFYDWENARTLGRRDIAFWRRLTTGVAGPVLELGCGTGRVSIPLARAGASLVGIDRSEAMLARAKSRIPNPKSRPAGPRFVRADIRALPFAVRTFAMVIAPYGILQSLLADADLAQTLAAVHEALRPGGTFGIDLVPDVPKWREYENRIRLRGRATHGAHFTLIESVRQDRPRGLTTFDQRYVERRGRTESEHRFALTFRTLPVQTMARALEVAGFVVKAVLGDYNGRPWDDRADVWIIVAEKV